MSEIRYTLAKSVDGDWLECIRCNSAAPTTMAEGLAHVDINKFSLRGRVCKFCYETELGTIMAYPFQAPPGQVAMARAIAQALNLVFWDDKQVDVEEEP